ncbi:rac serine-threonine kinase [Diplonema papillatum]|nr:rac serine-threonine kinase [Diplonema papillatum]
MKDKDNALSLILGHPYLSAVSNLSAGDAIAVVSHGKLSGENSGFDASLLAKLSEDESAARTAIFDTLEEAPSSPRHKETFIEEAVAITQAVHKQCVSALQSEEEEGRHSVTPAVLSSLQSIIEEQEKTQRILLSEELEKEATFADRREELSRLMDKLRCQVDARCETVLSHPWLRSVCELSGDRENALAFVLGSPTGGRELSVPPVGGHAFRELVSACAASDDGGNTKAVLDFVEAASSSKESPAAGPSAGAKATMPRPTADDEAATSGPPEQYPRLSPLLSACRVADGAERGVLEFLVDAPCSQPPADGTAGASDAGVAAPAAGLDQYPRLSPLLSACRGADGAERGVLEFLLDSPCSRPSAPQVSRPVPHADSEPSAVEALLSGCSAADRAVLEFLSAACSDRFAHAHGIANEPGMSSEHVVIHEPGTPAGHGKTGASSSAHGVSGEPAMSKSREHAILHEPGTPTGHGKTGASSTPGAANEPAAGGWPCADEGEGPLGCLLHACAAGDGRSRAVLEFLQSVSDLGGPSAAEGGGRAAAAPAPAFAGIGSLLRSCAAGSKARGAIVFLQSVAESSAPAPLAQPPADAGPPATQQQQQARRRAAGAAAGGGGGGCGHLKSLYESGSADRDRAALAFLVTGDAGVEVGVRGGAAADEPLADRALEDGTIVAAGMPQTTHQQSAATTEEPHASRAREVDAIATADEPQAANKALEDVTIVTADESRAANKAREDDATIATPSGRGHLQGLLASGSPDTDRPALAFLCTAAAAAAAPETAPLPLSSTARRLPPPAEACLSPLLSDGASSDRGGAGRWAADATVKWLPGGGGGSPLSPGTESPAVVAGTVRRLTSSAARGEAPRESTFFPPSKQGGSPPEEVSLPSSSSCPQGRHPHLERVCAAGGTQSAAALRFVLGPTQEHPPSPGLGGAGGKHPYLSVVAGLDYDAAGLPPPVPPTPPSSALGFVLSPEDPADTHPPPAAAPRHPYVAAVLASAAGDACRGGVWCSLGFVGGDSPGVENDVRECGCGQIGCGLLVVDAPKRCVTERELWAEVEKDGGVFYRHRWTRAKVRNLGKELARPPLTPSQELKEAGLWSLKPGKPDLSSDKLSDDAGSLSPTSLDHSHRSLSASHRRAAAFSHPGAVGAAKYKHQTTGNLAWFPSKETGKLSAVASSFPPVSRVCVAPAFADKLKALLAEKEEHMQKAALASAERAVVVLDPEELSKRALEKGTWKERPAVGSDKSFYYHAKTKERVWNLGARLVDDAREKQRKKTGNDFFPPACAACGVAYGKPPPRWECVKCKEKVWQPAADVRASFCRCCGKDVSREKGQDHCRRCGYMSCRRCVAYETALVSMGWTGKTLCTVCEDCSKKV